MPFQDISPSAGQCRSDAPVADAGLNHVRRTSCDGPVVIKTTPTEVSTTQPTKADVCVSSIPEQILDIIFNYALNKFKDTKQRLEAGRPHFLSVINHFVTADERLEMCLPAFPFKSANKVYKVFGVLPDKAEEIALDRLNSMCVRIGQLYKPGARCTIISNGLVYNNLLSISDRDTWAYRQGVRTMAVQKGFQHIVFSRLRDFVDFPLPEQLEEITYVANATNFRRYIFNHYGKEDIDIDHEIATDPDTKLTYLGYRRFLESDLRHIFPLGNGRSSNGYKRDVKYLAKQMLIRGYAFAGAVRSNFPGHLRLSIHQSTGEKKVSMSLLNTKTAFTTPWHCSVALMADGEWLSAPMGEFQKDPKMKIVYEDGRPSYFREVIADHRDTGINALKRRYQYYTLERNIEQHAHCATDLRSLSTAEVENLKMLAKMMSEDESTAREDTVIVLFIASSQALLNPYSAELNLRV